MYLNLLIILICVFIIYALLKQSKNELKVGDYAPSFELYDETGKLRTLNEFKGKKIVLYFYPKDETHGCTKQACQLSDSYNIYKQNNIEIIGISYDSIESHAKFKEKEKLPFILLSDSKKEVARLYDANRLVFNFVPKRKTFLINENGKIVYIIDKVDIKRHSNEVLKRF